MFCVNLWKRFYINTSVSEDNSYEEHIGMVSEDGAYGDSSGRLVFADFREYTSFEEPRFHLSMSN